jgi:hypothetical protein
MWDKIQEMGNVGAKAFGLAMHAGGTLYGLSKEHQKFLASGFKCSNCNKTLINALGFFTYTAYTADGSKKNNQILFGTEKLECPHCKYSWIACVHSHIICRNSQITT